VRGRKEPAGRGCVMKACAGGRQVAGAGGSGKSRVAGGRPTRHPVVQVAVRSCGRQVQQRAGRQAVPGRQAYSSGVDAGGNQVGGGCGQNARQCSGGNKSARHAQAAYGGRQAGEAKRQAVVQVAADGTAGMRAAGSGGV